MDAWTRSNQYINSKIEDVDHDGDEEEVINGDDDDDVDKVDQSHSELKISNLDLTSELKSDKSENGTMKLRAVSTEATGAEETAVSEEAKTVSGDIKVAPDVAEEQKYFDRHCVDCKRTSQVTKRKK